MWKWFDVNLPVFFFFFYRLFTYGEFNCVTWTIYLSRLSSVLLHGGTVVLALSRELIKALISENCKLPDWSNSISSKALESASQSMTSGCPGLLTFSLQYLNSKNHLFHCFWKYYFCAAVWTHVLLEDMQNLHVNIYISYYYSTLLSRVHITLKTSTNISRYLYSRRSLWPVLIYKRRTWQKCIVFRK